MDVIIGQIYRHFKGNLYKTLMLAENSETGEEMVVYQALYGENKVYVRPKDMFTEILDRSKYPEAKQKYRFELWGDAGAGSLQTEDSAGEKGNNASLSDDPVKREGTESISRPPQTVDPAQKLEDFLDTKDFSEKLRILQEMKNIVTDPMIDTMAFSIDLELNEGSTEDRYRELLGCVAVRERFENSRLRQ